MKLLTVLLLIMLLFITACSETGITSDYIITDETEESNFTNLKGWDSYTLSPALDYIADESETSKTIEVLEDRLRSLGVRKAVRFDINDDGVIEMFFNLDHREMRDIENLDELVTDITKISELTFREGELCNDVSDYEKLPVVLTGADVKEAASTYDTLDNMFIVLLELNSQGAEVFSEVTERLAKTQGIISIWLDDVLITAPRVNHQITGGSAQITGGGENGFSKEEAIALVNKINSGALPYKLEADKIN